MAYIPENTYNGFHVTANYYSTTGVDGSLARSLGAGTGTTALSFTQSAPFWSNLMSCQQSLFAGWNAFGGCCAPSTNPPTCGTQPQPQPQPQPCGDNTIDIHVYHYRCRDGSVRTFRPSSCLPCLGGYQSGYNIPGLNLGGLYQAGYQTPGCFGGFQSSYNIPGLNPGGYQGNYQTGCFGGYQPNYQTGCFGGYQPNYQTGCFGGYQGNYQTGCFGGYQGNYQTGCFGGYQGNYQTGCFGGYAGQYPTGGYSGFQGNYFPLPSYNYNVPQVQSYNWGDFNASFGSSSSSPFGVIPSAYAGYAMTSPFTDIGTATGLSLLGGALSMLF